MLSVDLPEGSFSFTMVREINFFFPYLINFKVQIKEISITYFNYIKMCTFYGIAANYQTQTNQPNTKNSDAT